MMLKLKLQYFGHLMRRVDSLEKTLMLGGIGGRRNGRQRMRWLDGITDSMDASLSELRSWWWTGMDRVAKSQTRLSDWTELNCRLPVLFFFLRSKMWIYTDICWLFLQNYLLNVTLETDNKVYLKEMGSNHGFTPHYLFSSYPSVIESQSITNLSADLKKMTFASSLCKQVANVVSFRKELCCLLLPHFLLPARLLTCFLELRLLT